MKPRGQLAVLALATAVCCLGLAWAAIIPAVATAKTVREAAQVIYAAPQLIDPSMDSRAQDESEQGSEHGRCTRRLPCSLRAARERVRLLLHSQHGPIEIHLRGGVYVLSAPLELDQQDSGRYGVGVTWQSEPGERAVLSGGLLVRGWRLFDSARNIWRAAVPGAALYRQLYVNGQRAERARSRNLMDGLVVSSTGYQLSDGPDITHFKNLHDVELVRLWEWEMSRCLVTEASTVEIRVHPTCFANSSMVDLEFYVENAFELLRKPGQWYLDRSGAVDGQPAVYFIPRPGEGMDGIEAWLGGTENLLNLAGTAAAPVHDVTFRRLTFAHAGWNMDTGAGGYASLQAGVYLLTKLELHNPSVVPASPGRGFYDPENFVYAEYLPGNVRANYAQRIVFDGNSFEHLGGTALALVHGVQDSSITDNTFEDISGSAIQIGGVEVMDHHPCGDHWPCSSPGITRNNRIAGNRIRRATQEYFDGIGIFAGYVQDTLIEHNSLVELNYTGISLGFGWGLVDANGHIGYKTPTIAARNRVIGNDISHHQLKLADGGAIYTLGALPDSEISGNYIHDMPWIHTGGIFLDEGTTGVSVKHNVVVNAMFFMHLNCGLLGNTYNNIIEDNLSDSGAVYNSCSPGKGKFGDLTGVNETGSLHVFFRDLPPPAARGIMQAAGAPPGNTMIGQ